MLRISRRWILATALGAVLVLSPALPALASPDAVPTWSLFDWLQRWLPEEGSSRIMAAAGTQLPPPDASPGNELEPSGADPGASATVQDGGGEIHPGIDPNG